MTDWLVAIAVLIGVAAICVFLVGGAIQDVNERSARISNEEQVCRPFARVNGFDDHGRHLSVCAAEDGGYVVREVAK